MSNPGKIIQLTDGTNRKIEINYLLLTVAKRREANRLNAGPNPTAITDDKEVLQALEAQFKAKAPNQMEIYEGYLKLVKPVAAGEALVKDDFIHEITRCCMRWLNKDGSTADVTKAEFDELPYEVVEYAKDIALTKSEVTSFLEVKSA